MYDTVAGLSVDFTRPDAPIRIAPLPGNGIDNAEASLITPFGLASSSWRREESYVD